MKSKVVIKRFESFNKFYVQKVENKCSSTRVKSKNFSTSIAGKLTNSTQQPPIGSIIETQTDKVDGIWYEAEVLAPTDGTSFIVRILSDGSICKTTKIRNLVNSKNKYYHCCLEADFGDSELVNDPINLKKVSNIMMSYEWTMETSSVKEPYKVALTVNGQDCIDILLNLWPTSYHEDTQQNNISVNTTKTEYEDALQEEKNPENYKTKANIIENNFILPNIETVVIKKIETLNCFYAESKSLFTLYMQRINAELKICKTQSIIFPDTIGMIVVAYSEELQRHCRARVIDFNSNGTRCYLLDHGEYEICREFYQASDFLRSLPPIVRCCSLYAPKLYTKQNTFWYSDVDDMFKDIVSLPRIEFEMIIKEDEACVDKCVVILKINNTEISEMICPINVQLTNINSFTDFCVTAISNDQKYVTELLETDNLHLVTVEKPIVNKLYIVDHKDKRKRVKLGNFGGAKYVVVDIDDTLDYLSVSELYEVPKIISDIPPFAIRCSLILEDDQDMYSMDIFKAMMDEKLIFLMSIIKESDVTKPNLVKLYFNYNNIFDILKL